MCETEQRGEATLVITSNDIVWNYLGLKSDEPGM